MTDILDVCFEGMSVHAVTMELVEHLTLNQPLTAEEVVAFAVDTQMHYRALQSIVEDACQGWEDIEDEEGYGLILHLLRGVIVDLDRAIGNSDKLNALIYTYIPAYGSLVHFHTTWDLLLASRAKAAARAYR